MSLSPIELDLQNTLSRIAQITTVEGKPGNEALSKVSVLLGEFVSRHRPTFSFDSFPLPEADDAVMSSYELTSEPDGPALIVNAIRGGVNSVVHDHGTWAVIIGIQGIECHRVYQRIDNPAKPKAATLKQLREVSVQEGEPLVLEGGLFHSIHTDTDTPALQLHLYGQHPDSVSSRQVLDPASGRLVYLSGPE